MFGCKKTNMGRTMVLILLALVICFGFSGGADAAGADQTDTSLENGTAHFIETEKGKQYVDQSGKILVSSWILVDGKDYYAGADGLLETDGFYTLKNGYTYYFDAEGVLQYGFISTADGLYYADKYGRIQTTVGWLSVGKKWYYVGTAGKIRVDSAIWNGGNLYYAGPDGALTGGIHEVNGVRRNFDASGSVKKVEGWVWYQGAWYYTNANGVVQTGKVITDKTATQYYLDANGNPAENLLKIDGVYRYFGSNGKIRTTSGWFSYQGDWYFSKEGGAIATDMIVGSSTGLYYVGKDGKTAGGIHTLTNDSGSTDYYFLKNGEVCKKNMWVKEDGEWYYANSDGTIRKNQVVWSDGTVYYLGSDGKLTGGVHAVGSTLRFFNPNGRLTTNTGWIKYQGSWYYIKGSGILYKNGKAEIDGQWYYFDANAVMQTGFIQKTGMIYYYAAANGVLKINETFLVNDIKYSADANGEVAVGTMYAKAQGYTSSTNYLILVNVTTQKTAVFKGSRNNWVLMKEFICSTGLKDSITPPGQYATTIHDLYFDSYGYRCWYATGFIGGLYLFHSSPYYMADTPVTCADRRMGIPTSHGCVRLELENAKWMYETLPLGTKVVIYE